MRDVTSTVQLAIRTVQHYIQYDERSLLQSLYRIPLYFYAARTPVNYNVVHGTFTMQGYST